MMIPTTTTVVPRDPYNPQMVYKNSGSLLGGPISVGTDLGLLPILADNMKSKTLKEVYEEAANMPVQPIPLVYVNDTPQYSQLKNDDDIKKSVIKYYYYKFLEKWVFDEMTGLLSFVKMTDGKASFIKTSDDFDVRKTSTDSKKNLQVRSDFLKDTFFTKNFVKKILKKITKKNGISWYDLYDHENVAKRAIYSEVVKYLKNKVSV